MSIFNLFKCRHKRTRRNGPTRISIEVDTNPMTNPRIKHKCSDYKHSGMTIINTRGEIIAQWKCAVCGRVTIEEEPKPEISELEKLRHQGNLLEGVIRTKIGDLL